MFNQFVVDGIDPDRLREHLAKARACGTSEEATLLPDLVSGLRALARPLRSTADLDPLTERIGDARCALLGEATHGTRERYTWRAALSRRQIVEAGASFIAVEGDWPDRYRVNRYVKGCADAGSSARAVLRAFDRWPTWMWANEEVADVGMGVQTPLRRQAPTRPNVRLTSSHNHDVFVPSGTP
ncbi:uncharacterized protein SOCE836_073500 [Sorangium cellulosum]|uniref:Erythromycin esterase n=1 Tax=Sorangium cellulosum TaxID=56 RepID=A0A4P2QY91_SORCE|nr:uncharacterized protein SOCE836_073500 [Sorangium cellulosum]WCQ94467.1 hypothetical protein NQZ70_07233 [Sorangium sp. Soce836]